MKTANGFIQVVEHQTKKNKTINMIPFNMYWFHARLRESNFMKIKTIAIFKIYLK